METIQRIAMPFELMPEEAPQEQSESLGSSLLRGAGRTASRVGEQIAGFPGDIFSLINDYIAQPAVEFATGEPGVPYEQTYLGKALPPTSEHRKRTTAAFGKQIEPQNKVEKFIDDMAQDATAIAFPVGRVAKFGKTVASSIAKSAGANLTGEFVKDLTSNEQKGAYGKLGSLFLLSLFDKPRAAKVVGDMYKPLQDQVTKLSPVNARPLEGSLLNLKSKMQKGTIAPSEKFIIDEVDAILPKIQNGQITPEELWAVKRSLNEKLSKILYDIPEKATQQRARKLASGIQHDIGETLKETAKQDPVFYKNLKAVDKAFGTIAKSNLVSKFIEKHMKYNPVTHGLIQMFQGSLGSAAATAALPYEAGKILYRISKSPILAKHYGKVLSSAAAEDSAVLNRELRKLDEGLKKEEKKDRFILVD